MPERETPPLEPTRDMSPEIPFDPEALGEALGSPANYGVSIQGRGPDYSYRLGDRETLNARLELFPDSHTIRYSNHVGSIDLWSPDFSVQTNEGGAVIDAPGRHVDARMHLAKSGEVTLFLSPKRAAQGSDEDAAEREKSVYASMAKIATERNAPQEALLKQWNALAKASEPESSLSGSNGEMTAEVTKGEEIITSNTKESAERNNRVEVTGRVGRDPRLQETKGGTAIAKFPLAEHPDGKEGETVWHTIVAFKALAQKVSETVHKGDEVKVIGYRQEREFRGKPQVEINAVAVRTPKTTEEKIDS